MCIRLIAAVALLGAAGPAVGQESPAEPPKTGSVAGVVIEQKSGEPVSKATVIFRRGEDGGIGATTGADGKFTLHDVDPGTYMLSVERDGYVIARGQPQTVVVQRGQTTPDLKVQLVRTGAIFGRILDPEGDPVSGVNVVLAAARPRKGAPSRTGYAITNDRGEYRIFYVAPGDYRMSATYAPTTQRHGVRMQRPEKAGAAPGAEAYPTVYYPGAIDSRQAVVLRVEPGAELPGIDLQLVRMHGVRVRGRVTAPSGSVSPPLFQMITLAPIGQHDASGQPHMSLIRDAKGEFEFTDVLPGEYRLQVMAGGVDQSNRMSAERMVDVGDQDIEGLQLTPGSPQTLNGQVIVPEGRKLPAGLVVMLGSREAGDTRGGGMAQVGGDGAFRIPDVASGDYDVLLASSSGTDDDSYIDTIRMGDRDALAEGVHVGEGQLPPLHIVLKPNGGAAECMVKDDQGDPVPDALVFAAPDAPKQRQAALYGECRAEADGTCKILGITPGDYHLYAFPPGTEIDYRDPDALKPFEKYSEAMKFAEGERKPVNLKTAPVE